MTTTGATPHARESTAGSRHLTRTPDRAGIDPGALFSKANPSTTTARASPLSRDHRRSAIPAAGGRPRRGHSVRLRKVLPVAVPGSSRHGRRVRDNDRPRLGTPRPATREVNRSTPPTAGIDGSINGLRRPQSPAQEGSTGTRRLARHAEPSSSRPARGDRPVSASAPCRVRSVRPARGDRPGNAPRATNGDTPHGRGSTVLDGRGRGRHRQPRRRGSTWRREGPEDAARSPSPPTREYAQDRKHRGCSRCRHPQARG